MFDFLGELFVRFILGILCVYPGAFVWWLWHGRKGSIDDVVKKNELLMLGMIGAIAMTTVVILVVLLVNGLSRH
ncbi:MAG: hypothetical protein ABI432_03270 [Flavobacteriales bacterium]